MEVDGLPLIGAGVNFTEVRAIHQKRTLAFINHFISNTVSFLNKFSRSCELRFEKFESQLQKLEASLSILEAKLLSISGLETGTSSQPAYTKDEPQANTTISATQIQDIPDDKTKEDSELKSKPVNEIHAAQDPRFAVFFRMIHVGVPIAAVRLKMQAEGLDPTILDNPGIPVTKAVPTDDCSDSGSTASSFSD